MPSKPSNSASRARLTGKLDVPSAAAPNGRRSYDVHIGPTQPLSIPLECFDIGKHIMTEGKSAGPELRRYGRNNRIGIFRGKIESVARALLRLRGSPAIARLEQPVSRRTDILPASAGMHRVTSGPPAAMSNFSSSR